MLKYFGSCFLKILNVELLKDLNCFIIKKGVVGLIIEIIVNGLEIYIYYVIGFDKNREYEF